MHTVLKGLAAANGKPPEMVDWTDFIKFEGIVYQSIHGPGPPRIPGERTFTEADLGDLLYRVAFRVQDYVGVSYRAQDGDSGFLVPGTPVFAVKDYSPRFRLAALQDGKVLVFEADFNRNARTGADLLDIEGKVRAVTFYDETEPNYMDNEIARVDEPGVVADIVSMVMAAPVDQTQLDRGDERYLVVFWLDDGSAVERWYRLESGRLSRGIQLPAEFAKYLPSGGEGE
ncbi:MAG: hypothetical protein Q8O40_09860 [Chloroflexota bacterium]|nr:hypothetical protein [Chloroflexota bacterium]